MGSPEDGTASRCRPPPPAPLPNYARIVRLSNSIIRVLRRPRRGSARPVAAAFLTLAAPLALGGQAREVDRYGVGSAEGRLLAFYSAALAFSPAGAAPEGTGARRTGRVEAGLELSYIPRLSAAQRSAGFDKPEATNLAPLVPRPRASLALGRGVVVDAGWLPPVRVFDVRAQLFSAAVSAPLVTAGGVVVSGRGSFTTGRVRGPITCSASLAQHPSRDLRLYFASVCYGRASDDHFMPRQLGGELLAAREAPWRGARPYAGAGLRAQRARFDIGVIRRDGTRDPDEPILELRGVRGYAFAGASRPLARWARLGGEVYYEPGSLLTVRMLAAVRLRRELATAPMRSAP